MTVVEQPEQHRWVMRRPCIYCGHDFGYWVRKALNDCVYCGKCDKYQKYNATREETGQPRETKRARPALTPSQRSRVFAVSNTCVVCHRGDVPLEVGHLISVAEGRAMDVPDDLLFSDDNLAPFCEACNSGQSSRSVNTRLMYQCLRIQAAHRDDHA